MGPDLQAQLLRVIQDRAVTPVGDHRSQPVDVRIIAATNRDLRGDVAAGRFRLDLYYRLNVVKLTTIPLSQRPEDIEPLCHGFLERWSIENGLPPRRVSAAALQTLMDYEWPGNVRQLQNILERATVFTDSRDIAPEHLLEALDSDREPVIAGRVGDLDELAPTPSRPCHLCAMARRVLRIAAGHLADAGGVRVVAAPRHAGQDVSEPEGRRPTARHRLAPAVSQDAETQHLVAVALQL